MAMATPMLMDILIMERGLLMLMLSLRPLLRQRLMRPISMEDIMVMDMAMATPMLMDILIMERGLLMLSLRLLLRQRLMPPISMEDIMVMDMATPTPMDIPIMERGLLMLTIFMEDIMDILTPLGFTLDTLDMFTESKSLASNRMTIFSYYYDLITSVIIQIGYK